MITKTKVDALPPGGTIWDEGKGAVAGFFARRQKSPAVSFVVFYRTAGGRQRFQTIGRYGAPWTVVAAREEARRLLGLVAAGGDPAGDKQEARKAENVGDLCDAYIADAEAGRILTRGRTKKPSTLATDKGRVERHIKPLLGRMKVAAVDNSDVETFRDAVAEGKTAARIKTGPRGLARVTGGKGTSTRTMALLGVIFSYAVRKKLRTDNPVRGVEAHAYECRKRRMTAEEYRALGRALDDMPLTWPIALAATRFLAVTGWRRGEVLGLKWSEIDLPKRTAHLTDTKTGASIRPLSATACEILCSLPRMGELVFPGSTGQGGPIGGYTKTWLKIAAKAGLPAEITPHVFRHSVASIAGDLGYSELTIGALIGHKGKSITSRYVHSADAVLLAAADAVAERILCLMRGVQDV
jgi:integrase